MFRNAEKIPMSYDDVVAMFKAQGFTDENQWAQAVVKSFQKQEAALTNDDFVVSLSDVAVPENLKPLAAKWRNLAKYLGYDGPTARRVRSGFTLKKHAPNAGPCYQQFLYLQDWNFTDEPTKDAIVFWVPRLVPESTSKTASEQMALLADLRREFGLPKTHLVSFGSTALLAGLIFAHYKATGERVPLDRYWIRTDICRSDGRRLDLGCFDEFGLDCGDWRWHVGRYPIIGVFAVGVELGS